MNKPFAFRLPSLGVASLILALSSFAPVANAAPRAGKSFGDWRVAGTWHRYQERPDRYTSRIGSDTSFLSANTDTLADQLRLSVTWSGIQAWRAGRLPMPLIVRLEVQDAVAGRNFVDVRDVYLRLTSLF